jgi:DNA polymerase I-like protein with 3'-5' exonuclease and polymerase domains
VYARTEKTKRPSTDESVLAQLSHPFVDLLRKYRKLKKLYGTYVEPYREYAVRGRIHCDYLLGGTVTGRLASHNPALQTIPNDKRIRDFFVPRSGWVLVQADFSQIELRVAAFISRDEVLLDAFRRQFDVHTLTASRILGKPLHRVTAEDRRLAKPVNFGLVYGMGARKLRDYARREYGVELSEEQAKEFRARFFGLYRGLHPWHEGVRNAVRRLQYVVSPLGRVRHLPNVRAQDDEVQGEAMRQAVNSPVQGMASDMTLLAMVLLDRELDPAHALLVANNHDAILFEADPERLPETLSQIKETMEHLPLEEMFGCKLDVPIEVEIKTGPSWGSLIPWSPPSPAPLSDELKSSEPTWSRPTEASTASEASPTC